MSGYELQTVINFRSRSLEGHIQEIPMNECNQVVIAWRVTYYVAHWNHTFLF